MITLNKLYTIWRLFNPLKLLTFHRYQLIIKYQKMKVHVVVIRVKVHKESVNKNQSFKQMHY